MNYFNSKAAAERYSKGRPDFHGDTIKHIQDFLRLETKFDRALDIACGTGLSTKALLEIAIHVDGTDISRDMLNLAPKTEGINYTIATAEQQPFPDNSFDLITVSSGVHWFDIDKFLVEACRLLKSKSWLILYENYFNSEMVDNGDFKIWFTSTYLKKFPSPPRNNKYQWTKDNLSSKNLDFISEKAYQNSIAFNKKELALYFTTQSNIISAVEKGETSYQAAELWLEEELSAFFDNESTTRTSGYGNWIKFIQRSS
jgi:ubiquinone/menaquinone biosynthesis C-methylase UbiE